MYTCELRHVYKELQCVSTCKGASMSDFAQHGFIYKTIHDMIEGSLEVKLPTIWTDEKQSREEAERRGRLEERRSEEKE